MRALFLIISICCLNYLSAQTIIFGKITDATNEEPLIGAFVSIKGSQLTTVSSTDGSFQIIAPSVNKGTKMVLSVSHLGYHDNLEVLELMPVDDGESIERNVVLSPDPLTLKDVTVTANKVEEELQDVPIAATVITAENMQKRTVADVEEAFESVPNLVIEGYVPSQTSVSLRGLASDFTNVGVENSVGLYIDDVYYSRSANFNSSIMDIERVEVLRGPQGTNFGKNSIGGVLHIIPEKPKMANFGAIELNAGNFNYLRVRAKGNTMLVKDKLALRVSGAYRKRDGWMLMENPEIAEENGILFYGGRASLLFKPNDNITFNLKGSFSKDERADIRTDYKTPETGDVLPVDKIEQNHFDRRGNINDDNRRFKRDLFGVNGKLDIKLGNRHTLTSVTAYHTSTTDAYRDFDGTSFDAFGNGRYLETKNISQEIRIATPRENQKFFYVLGAFFLKEEINNDDELLANEAAEHVFRVVRNLPGLDLPPSYEEVAINHGRNSSTSYAAFLNTSYEFSDRIRLNAGLRYNYEDKTADYWQDVITTFPIAFINQPIGAMDNPISRDTSNSVVTGNIGMDFKTTDNILLYVNYSRGVKGSGFNVVFARDSVVFDRAFIFKPEFINSYEFGIKLKMQNRFLFNAAVFVTDFINKQEAVAVGNNIFVSNAEAVQGQGIEAEFVGVWNRFFKTEVSLGALNMKYTNFPFVDPNSVDPGTLLPTDTINLSGNRAFKAPDFTFKFSPEFHFPLGRELNLLLRADYNFVGKIYNDIFNTETIARAPTGILNARLGVSTKNKRFEVALWGKNILDKTYIQHGWTFAFGDLVALNNPRLIGVELRANFY